MNKPAVLICFSIIIFSTCTGESDKTGISSGIIEYRINYLNDDIEGKDLSLLPRTMKLVFNKNMAVNYIDGFLGMYRLNTITKFETRKCLTMLKVFDRNYLYRGKKDELMCCFEGMEDMEVQETGETMTIAGLNCKKAVITLPSQEVKFDIYYTNDIALRHPNQNNPYRLVDGVLIKFELKLLHLRMEFMAENFEPNAAAKQQPEIPFNSMEIDRDQMTQILNKLME